VTLKDRPHGRRGEAVSEAGEFAVDASVAPRRVLGREAYDELFEVPRSAGPTRLALGMHPPTGGEASVPAQQCVGRDDEPREHPTWEEPSQAGEDGAVGFAARGAWHMAVQHGDLAAQRDDFCFKGTAGLRTDHQETNDGDEQPVVDRAQARGDAVARGGGRHHRTVPARHHSQPTGAVNRVRWGL